MSVREIVDICGEIGIGHLTLYAFSAENWNRPKLEVYALMELLVSTISKETKTLMDNGVRLNAIGDLNSLPAKCLKQLRETILKTSENNNCTLTLALSYSSRWEITEAARELAVNVRDGKLRAEDITEDIFAAALNTANMPDPELMIRTSGEYRISNFLLWQAAYSELYITSVLWPDFRKIHLHEAIASYQSRERRFGKTSEQIVNHS